MPVVTTDYNSDCKYSAGWLFMTDQPQKRTSIPLIEYILCINEKVSPLLLIIIFLPVFVLLREPPPLLSQPPITHIITTLHVPLSLTPLLGPGLFLRIVNAMSL